MTLKESYDVLGLKPAASEAVLKRRFRQAIRLRYLKSPAFKEVQTETKPIPDIQLAEAYATVLNDLRRGGLGSAVLAEPPPTSRKEEARLTTQAD